MFCMRWCFRVLFSAILMLLVGCAGSITDPLNVVENATFDYRNKSGFLDFEGQARVAVGVVDQRQPILSGAKSDNFVGLVRSGFGVPYDVLTHTKAPLANDLAYSFSLTLEFSGLATDVLELSSVTNVDESQARLMDFDANRYLLVILNEWRSNTYSRTEFNYNIDLIVFSSDGAEVLQKTFSGSEVGSDSSFSPKERNTVVLSKIYLETLQKIFDDAEVTAALTLAANEEPVNPIQ